MRVGYLEVYKFDRRLAIFNGIDVYQIDLDKINHAAFVDNALLLFPDGEKIEIKDTGLDMVQGFRMLRLFRLYKMKKTEEEKEKKSKNKSANKGA